MLSKYTRVSAAVAMGRSRQVDDPSSVHVVPEEVGTCIWGKSAEEVGGETLEVAGKHNYGPIFCLPSSETHLWWLSFSWCEYFVDASEAWQGPRQDKRSCMHIWPAAESGEEAGESCSASGRGETEEELDRAVRLAMVYSGYRQYPKHSDLYPRFCS